MKISGAKTGLSRLASFIASPEENVDKCSSVQIITYELFTLTLAREIQRFRRGRSSIPRIINAEANSPFFLLPLSCDDERYLRNIRVETIPGNGGSCGRWNVVKDNSPNESSGP